MNQKGISRDSKQQRLQVGDKVMQIRNNYDKEVFNGDLGIVSSIDSEEGSVEVDFEGRKVLYESCRPGWRLFWPMPSRCINPRDRNFPASLSPCTPPIIPFCKEILYIRQ